MAAKETLTRVSAYKKETPKHYESHEGRVRGWVPEGSPYAERGAKKKR